MQSESVKGIGKPCPERSRFDSRQLEPFGVAADRIYVQFHDQDRANVGWSGKTFAG